MYNLGKRRPRAGRLLTMTLPPPSAEAQVAFLHDVQRLLVEGSFTATYKFALLQALADLAVLRGDDSGNGLTLRTRDIAEAMIGLYWRQAVPYPGAADAGVLRQNTKGQAAIVTRLLRARGSGDGSLARLRQDGREWDCLVGAVDRVVREMPLWRLQQVADTRLDFLYPHSPGAAGGHAAARCRLLPARVPRADQRVGARCLGAVRPSPELRARRGDGRPHGFPVRDRARCD